MKINEFLSYATPEQISKLLDVANARGGSIAVDDAKYIIPVPWEKIATNGQVLSETLLDLYTNTSIPQQPTTLSKLLRKVMEHV